MGLSIDVGAITFPLNAYISLSSAVSDLIQTLHSSCHDRHKHRPTCWRILKCLGKLIPRTWP